MLRSILYPLLAITMVCGTIGCGESEQQVTTEIPEGSPTESVDAALAFNEGVKLRESNKLEAISYFNTAIEADPSFEIAYYNRALTLAELGKISAAEEDLEKLKELGSDRVPALESVMEVAREFFNEE